jgi:hypothetical protein
MRRLLKIALALLLVGLAAGHVVYWYWPRERAAAPEPGGLPARLLASGAYDACLWVPYPHQNLGVLAESVGDGPSYLAAVARVADLPRPVLPSFGPFALPPSSEIVACSDLEGNRFLLVARVYPALGAVARLAGRLAGNPWLQGGEVKESEGKGDEVVERTVRVAWRDSFWTVSSGPESELDWTATLSPFPPSLGIARLEREVSDFPAGDYLLQRQDGDLQVELSGSGPLPEKPEMGGKIPPVLIAVAGPSWPAREPRPLPPAAFILFDTDDGIQAGPLGRLPGAAVLHPPGRERWSLPAQGIAGLLANRLPKGNADGWRIVALDGSSLRRAKRLAPRISALTPPGEEGETDGRLILGLWVLPGPTQRLVEQTRKVLEKIPLVDRDQVQLWRDWERLLDPIARCGEVSLGAVQSPPSFRLRFHGCD